MFKIGVVSVENHIDSYKKGVEDFIKDMRDFTSHIIPAAQWDKIKDMVLDQITNIGKELAELSLSFIEDFLGQFFLFFLYLVFWLFEPLPVSEPIAKVFKNYLGLKTIVCFIYASMMAILLAAVQCPVWALYFFITFFLNYIPEVGPILAGVLTLPSVLLDGSITKTARYEHVTVIIIVGMICKFLTGNVLEVDLYTRFGGEFMRIHPVVLFVFFTFCGYQLGVSGMFVSIPILAAIKYSLVSQAMPDKYLGTMLVIIEGDKWAPHKNLYERHRCSEVARTLDVSSEIGTELAHAAANTEGGIDEVADQTSRSSATDGAARSSRPPPRTF